VVPNGGVELEPNGGVKVVPNGGVELEPKLKFCSYLPATEQEGDFQYFPILPNTSYRAAMGFAKPLP